jgi:transcriptional regulator with XRE-family HTH domain
VTVTSVDLCVGKGRRTARERRGLSRDALATRIGVPVVELQAYEDGAQRAGAQVLFGIAQALSAPLGEFFGALGSRGGAI